MLLTFFFFFCLLSSCLSIHISSLCLSVGPPTRLPVCRPLCLSFLRRPSVPACLRLAPSVLCSVLRVYHVTLETTALIVCKKRPSFESSFGCRCVYRVFVFVRIKRNTAALVGERPAVPFRLLFSSSAPHMVLPVFHVSDTHTHSQSEPVSSSYQSFPFTLPSACVCTPFLFLSQTLVCSCLHSPISFSVVIDAAPSPTPDRWPCV